MYRRHRNNEFPCPGIRLVSIVTKPDGAVEKWDCPAVAAPHPKPGPVIDSGPSDSSLQILTSPARTVTRAATRPCYIRAVRILLVDDDAELCNLLGEFLKREGFQVDFAHDGHSGLNKAES